jgi:N-acetylmuramoyl-L-alanine amidase
MLPAAFRFLVGLTVLVSTSVLAASARSVPSRPTASAATKINGVEYVDLTELCVRFGVKRASVSARRAVFKSEGTTLEFDLDSRDHQINGLRVFTGEPVRSQRGRWWISRIDAETLLTPVLRPGTNEARVPALKTIVIDPGHGGRDPGKVNPRVKVMEKDIALDTAKRAKVLLEAQGYRVFLTRNDDRYLDLPDRAEIAAKHGADLFVAIHFNSVETRADQVTGVEVFSLTPQFQFSTADSTREDEAEARTAAPANRYDHWNAAASYAMHRELIGTLGVPDRGLKRARWKVLVLAPCPATYVEGGYLSNDAEARKLATPAYRQKVAEGIARGVRAYAATLQRLRDRS